MPRPKKYDWSDKKEICHKLYIEERRPMREVIKYFSEALGVPKDQLPIGQAFTRQFREWGFPSRRFIPSAEDEAKIVARIQELWGLNYGNAVIADTLRSDGWEMTDINIANIRRKHGLHLRGGSKYEIMTATDDVPKARWADAKETASPTLSGDPAIPQHLAKVDTYPVHQEQLMPPSPMEYPFTAPGAMMPQPGAMLPSPQPQSTFPRVTKRTLQELQEQSEDLLNTRKRRRRIRGRGQLAPDAPGLPPRYKSETTLDECKAFLQLTNELYQSLRQQYMDICNEAGIVKKSLCQPGVWEISKDRLIRENAHLNNVMNVPHPEADKVANALEVICADVTKRIRVLSTKLSLADANNGLGLNPTESKHLRKLFYDILEADGFTTRMECGDDRWEQHYNLWMTKSDILIRLQQRGIDEQTRKFLNMLMRDAMKRLNDGRIKNDPRVRQYAENSYGPGPGPARGKHYRGSRNPKEKVVPQPRGSTQDQALPTEQPITLPATLPSDLDPALFTPMTGRFALPALPISAVQIPAYFRLAPTSNLIGHHPKMWLGKLTHVTMAALHTAATSKASAAKVGRVHGIVKNEADGEDSYLVDGDEELEAYLETAKELAEGKAVFVVELDAGYA